MTETMTDLKGRERDVLNVRLPRDGQKDIKLRGVELSEVSSKWHRGEAQNRWTEISLYKSCSGKLVAYVCGRTQWQGEQDRHAVHVCETQEELINDLGTGWLAKEAYEEAGIECVEEVV